LGRGIVAICFLNSYANPDNERTVGKQLAALLPDVFFTLSSEVAPQIREYPRASTAAVNAYAMPISLPIQGLSERLKRENLRTRRSSCCRQAASSVQSCGPQSGAHDRERPRGWCARRLPHVEVLGSSA
jgi:hypothetical protein